jgi:hypothetical protein
LPNEATVYLNKVVNPAEYGSASQILFSFMAYEGDDYKQATKYFDEVSVKKSTKKSLYYQADMNFKLTKAIDLGQKAMANLFGKIRTQIIGESYFNLKKYDTAIPF